MFVHRVLNAMGTTGFSRALCPFRPSDPEEPLLPKVPSIYLSQLVLGRIALTVHGWDLVNQIFVGLTLLAP